MRFVGLHYVTNISTFCDTGGPENDRDWMENLPY